MSVSLGQAISIIGGSPILKNVLGHTVDKLKIPRHIDVGNVPGMSSIMSGILSGGTSTLLQSPLGSALAPLVSGITAAVAQLGTSGSGSGSSTPGTDTGSGASFAPVVAALNSLSTSATNLSALADNLIGYASNAALPTQFDAIGHANLSQSLGTALPASVSLATVMAPTGSAGLLTTALAGIQPIVAQALAGTMAVTDAAAAIAAIQTGLDAVTNASTGAITSLQAMAPALAAGQAAIALLVAGPPEMVAAMTAAIRPDQMAAVQAIMAAHNEALAMAASTQSAADAAAANVAAAVAAAAASAPTP